MADFTLVALKDEIVADPEGLGYKNSATPNDWKGDQVIADLINDSALGADVFRKNVPMDDIFAEIDWVVDWLGLTGQRNTVLDKQLAFRLITSTDVLDANSAYIRAAFAGIFAGTSGGTLERLNALTQKAGSRAEVLWGDGQQVSVSQVGHAFNEI